MGVMTSHRSEETESFYIADLVVALKTGQIKLRRFSPRPALGSTTDPQLSFPDPQQTGTPCRFDRMAKVRLLPLASASASSRLRPDLLQSHARL